MHAAMNRGGRSGRKWIGITGIVMTIPGLIFLGLGIWQYFSARSFVNEGVTTQGRIVEMRTVSGNDGVMFSPVFAYEDGRGGRYLKESSTANYPAKYKPGDTVKVIYQPDDPIDAKIYSFFGIWGVAAIFLIIGGVFLFLGLIGGVLIGLLIRFLFNRTVSRTYGGGFRSEG